MPFAIPSMLPLRSLMGAKKLTSIADWLCAHTPRRTTDTAHTIRRVMSIGRRSAGSVAFRIQVMVP